MSIHPAVSCLCLWCLWWRFLWIFRNSSPGAEHSSGPLWITSVSPRVRCAGFFRKWFDPSGPVVPVFLGRVAAFNLPWRGGVARVAAASGPWPSERLSGRPHRGHRFRAVAIGETLRVPTRLLFQEPLPSRRATPVASVAAVSGSRGEGTRATHPRGRLSGATCRRRRRPFS